MRNSIPASSQSNVSIQLVYDLNHIIQQPFEYDTPRHTMLNSILAMSLI